MLNSYKYGWKTSYYQNTYDFKGEDEDVQPAGLSDVIEDDNDGEEVELKLSNRQIVNGHAKVSSVEVLTATNEEDDCDACTI